MVGGLGQDTILGGPGDDRLLGGTHPSTLAFIEGPASANWLSDKADLILGGSGDDLLDGGGGNDTLLGGAGRDTLIGTSGKDLLAGGSGDDTFVFTRSIGVYGGAESGVGPGRRDVILDFHEGHDLLDFSVLASRSGQSGSPVPGAAFLGEEPFEATYALQIRVAYEDGNTILQYVSAQWYFLPGYPPERPSGPEGEIELAGIHHLQARGFILG
ncbi:hypothetical protein [Dankookia sp. P2]|uniref:hypothetical protein n=1 Tax=Dankookia sp. P2 TaxID=3423955 RepID=UPI003D675280